MKRQTATEYFYDRVISIFTKYHEEDVPTIDFGKLITEAFERAKAMEKEHLMMAFNDGKVNSVLNKRNSEQYYTSTYEQ